VVRRKGARDDAIASTLIRDVDLANLTVFHDAREVRSACQAQELTDLLIAGFERDRFVVTRRPSAPGGSSLACPNQPNS
jgi:hypothetical protein